MSKGSVAALICLILGGTISVRAQSPSSSELREDLVKQKAVTACTECHEARIIVQQRLSKATWTKEVDKMIKWGAVVDAQDHDPLIDYLSTNFGVDRPEYVAIRSAKKTKTQGK